MTRIGVLGSHGRTGQAVIRLLKSDRFQATLIGEADRVDPLESLFSADVVIDFAAPEAPLNLLKLSAQKTGKTPALVVGSTPWKISEKRELETAAQTTPILVAPCLSMGFHVLQEALRKISPLLNKAGFDSVVLETERKDHPSGSTGTATISLQSILSPEASGNVTVQSVRAKSAPSTQEIRCYLPGETLFFTHQLEGADSPARLSIEAAIWLHQQKLSGKLSHGLIGQDVFFASKFS